jgi:hypothetical protein
VTEGATITYTVGHSKFVSLSPRRDERLCAGPVGLLRFLPLLAGSVARIEPRYSEKGL